MCAVKAFQFLSGLLAAALLVGATGVPAIAQITTGTTPSKSKDGFKSLRRGGVALTAVTA